VPRFITASVPPIGRRKKPFPSDQRELCLATAWRLIEDGQSVLIFCPLRKSVEPFAEAIVNLNSRGALPSVLEHDESILATALAIGAEWFGPHNALLQCLKLGVAIHHGALPTPFRKEVERLLRDGVLKIIVSSPTLAQGLNLTATALVIHGLVRNREVIKSSEFRNIIGRAGRAYVDLEGLVLYPMFDDQLRRRKEWNGLIADTAGKEMESGLVRLLVALLIRMKKKIGAHDIEALIEYVTNNSAWSFSELSDEKPAQIAIEADRWHIFLTSLDTAILSLLGEQEVTDEDIETKLDAVLDSSLWTRRLKRQNESVQKVLKAGLVARAKFVWTHSTPIQRRGYFLAGIGLSTGQQLDTHAATLGELLVQANIAILEGESDMAIAAIISFAKIIFGIAPFIPDDLPDNWPEILAMWLNGKPIVTLAGSSEAVVLQFIEQGLIYKLPWGMEAVRVRGLAHDDYIYDNFKLSDFELSAAVAAVETGSLNRSAALLIRSGFSSRLAAIKAVEDGEGHFQTAGELRQWIKSETVSNLSEDMAWPSPETHELWKAFVHSLLPSQRQTWRRIRKTAKVKWIDGLRPSPSTPLSISGYNKCQSLVLSAEYEYIGQLTIPLNPDRKGLLRAVVGAEDDTIDLDYLGPDDIYSD
jgi:hypothetical protein